VFDDIKKYDKQAQSEIPADATRFEAACLLLVSRVAFAIGFLIPVLLISGLLYLALPH
jgi:hypothetical protein